VILILETSEGVGPSNVSQVGLPNIETMAQVMMHCFKLILLGRVSILDFLACKSPHTFILQQGVQFSLKVNSKLGDGEI